MGWLPPVGNAALAFAAGAALAHTGAWWSIAPLAAPVLLAAPTRASGRRLRPWIWLLVGVAGWTSAAAARSAPGCLERRGELRGRFLARPVSGSAPFRIEGSRCELRVVVGDADAPAGRLVAVAGRWREGRAAEWFQGATVERVADPSPGPGWLLVRWRASLVERLGRQYGARAPIVSALILARREGLATELRDGFARAGLAHLLAISGFHVGVISGMALACLRLAGVPVRRAGVAAAGVTWLYVSLLGFPDAATRAAVIIALVAVSRAGGRPPARWGALGAALLVLLAIDPTSIAGPGFQLSFAGAAGLIAWARPLRVALDEWTRGRAPRSLTSAIAAGVAATVATLPIVAWHFERVSLVGVPATLLAGPLVALAVPGAIVGLAASLVAAPFGAFVAGGVDVCLAALERVALAAAAPEWASVWVPRAYVPVAAVGAALGAWVARRAGARGASRRALVGAWTALAAAAWPVALSLADRGTVQLLFLDVGQGDAIAIRTPRARWILVDAGPPGAGRRARHPVLGALRGRGVTRLEALVLTHPDLDHIGGAAEVVADLPVGAIVDPARPSPKGPYGDLLRAAAAERVPWRRALAGQRWELDGLRIEVLAPSAAAPDADTEANAASVVLRVRWGDFDALLTGDAPAAVERAFAPSLEGTIEVLKVGHHGSSTSTGRTLLRAAPPELAVVSVGRANRYGHPAPTVLARLRATGTRIVRTDRHGTVRVVGRRDGGYTVELERHGR